MGKKVKELESNPMKKKGESAHCLVHAGGHIEGRINHDKIWRYTREHGGKTPLRDGVAV